MICINEAQPRSIVLFFAIIVRLGWRMTGDKFRARADEYIKVAHSIADPVRKLALMDIAQRWLRLAAQIDAEHRPEEGSAKAASGKSRRRR